MLRCHEFSNTPVELGNCIGAEDVRLIRQVELIELRFEELRFAELRLVW